MGQKITYDELINGLSNPLTNRKLLDAILMEKSKGKRSNIRRLEVVGAKKPDDSAGVISYDDAFKFESELFHYIIKQYYEAIMNDRSRLNQNMITPNLLRDENISKVKDLAEAPLDLIEHLRFDLFEKGPLRDPFKTDERERNVYAKMKEKYGLEEDLTYLLASVYQNMVRFDEHIGRSGFGNLFSGSGEPYSIRIYLNTPEGRPTLDFAKAYIKKCIEAGLDYDAKFAFNSISNDRTILYAKGKDIVKRVEVLEEIARENPELIEMFGTPIMNTATFDGSYYGIAHAGVVSKSGSCVQTYNDYFDNLVDASFILMKARVLFQRLFFDKAGLREGEFQFVQDITTLKKFASMSGGAYERQDPVRMRYFPNFEYKDGFGTEEATPDVTGEVFRTEGLSWQEIDRRLNDILARKPEIEAKIIEKKKSKELDLSQELGKSMVLLSNYTQRRDLSAKSNVAISKKMEDLLEIEREQ